MKVLLVLYHLNDLGGIINTQEAIYAGFKELGHKVTVRKLLWNNKVPQNRLYKFEGENEPSLLGGNMDQSYGNRTIQRFAYKGKENLLRWKEFASKFDLIVWQVPIIPKSKNYVGNTDWIELYNIPVKQVLYIQDGNMWRSYPHINAITKYVSGGAATQLCAYNTLAKLPLPRAFIPPPQTDIAKRVKAADKSEYKRKGWLSLQAFKAWKHVDDIVRAVPYMGDYPKRLAGGGIECDYMRSKIKVKNDYRIIKKNDPDCNLIDIDKPIWTHAVDHGMKYFGFINNAHREKLLHKSAALIDSSWSDTYAEIGGDYFNRVATDAAIGGAALIAIDKSMGPQTGGEGTLFQPGVNYMPISYKATPKQFADAVNHYLSNGYKKSRAEIVEGGRKLLPFFEPAFAAQAFIDLAKGKEAGYFKKNIPGKEDPFFVKEGEELIERFYANRPRVNAFFKEI